MARAALQWSLKDLANRAAVSADTVSRMEAGQPVKKVTQNALSQALEKAGVIFASRQDGRECVCFQSLDEAP
jgi:transcriptional regulator with XRE-family HTH domain